MTNKLTLTIIFTLGFILLGVVADVTSSDNVIVNSAFAGPER